MFFDENEDDGDGIYHLLRLPGTLFFALLHVLLDLFFAERNKILSLCSRGFNLRSPWCHAMLCYAVMLSNSLYFKGILIFSPLRRSSTAVHILRSWRKTVNFSTEGGGSKSKYLFSLNKTALRVLLRNFCNVCCTFAHFLTLVWAVSLVVYGNRIYYRCCCFGRGYCCCCSCCAS